MIKKFSTEVVLTAVRGSLQGRSFKFISPNIIAIGRHSSCDIRLHERTISRHHCAIEIDGCQSKIQDLGSKNGTYLNKQKLEYFPGKLSSTLPKMDSCLEYILRDGDEIKIEKNSFKLSIVLEEDCDRESLLLIEDDLKSERGIDYIKLREYLKTKQWKKANQQTNNILSKALAEVAMMAGLNRLETIKRIQSEIQIVDRLWTHYSFKRFGFSVQQNILLELEFDPFKTFCNVDFIDNNFARFYQKIGWDKPIKFNILAPRGHLPQLNHCPFQAYCSFLMNLEIA